MLFSETLSLVKVPLRMQISFVSLFGQAVGPLSCVPSVGGFPSVCPVLQPFALLLWVHRMHSSPWASFQTWAVVWIRADFSKLLLSFFVSVSQSAQLEGTWASNWFIHSVRGPTSLDLPSLDFPQYSLTHRDLFSYSFWGNKRLVLSLVPCAVVWFCPFGLP